MPTATDYSQLAALGTAGVLVGDKVTLEFEVTAIKQA